MASKARTTTDHEEIRRWAEERGGAPAAVKRTSSDGEPGILRIDFPGYTGEGTLEHIEWDEWFRKFDENGLALLYQEETSGGQRSNFNKIIARETAKARARGIKTSRHHPARGRSASSRVAAGKRSGAAKTTRTSRSSRGRRKAASSRQRTSAASRSNSGRRASSRKSSGGRRNMVGGKKVSARSHGGRSRRRAA